MFQTTAFANLNFCGTFANLDTLSCSSRAAQQSSRAAGSLALVLNGIQLSMVERCSAEEAKALDRRSSEIRTYHWTAYRLGSGTVMVSILHSTPDALLPCLCFCVVLNTVLFGIFALECVLYSDENEYMTFSVQQKHMTDMARSRSGTYSDQFKSSRASTGDDGV